VSSPAPPGSAASRFTGVLGTVILASLVIVGLAVPAQAHVELVRSSPADGALLSSAPAEVVLTLSEEASSGGTLIAVAGPDGAPVTVEPTEVSGTVVSAALPPLPDRGTYTVAYRVVSGDGHAVSGSIRFTVGDASDVSSSAPSASSTSGIVTGAIVIVGGLALLAVIAVTYVRRSGLRSDDDA
jgi:copper resistance protein C